MYSNKQARKLNAQKRPFTAVFIFARLLIASLEKCFLRKNPPRFLQYPHPNSISGNRDSLE